MSRFLDESIVAQAREARRKLSRGADRAGEAVAEVEGLLRDLGVAARTWVPLGKRTIRSRQGRREVEISLGYTDEGDGKWGVKLRAVDPLRALPDRFVRLSACPSEIRVRLLPQLKKLAELVVTRAREMADLIEETISGEKEAQADRSSP